MLLIYGAAALGGAIGSVARFWLAAIAARLTGPAFPWGTVAINIAGSFLIGWFAALMVYGRSQNADLLRAFAMAGLCGGFTTFSSFSLQTLELLREGHPWAAAGNVIGSVVLCVAATGAGLAVGRG